MSCRAWLQGLYPLITPAGVGCFKCQKASGSALSYCPFMLVLNTGPPCVPATQVCSVLLSVTVWGDTFAELPKPARPLSITLSRDSCFLDKLHTSLHGDLSFLDICSGKWHLLLATVPHGKQSECLVMTCGAERAPLSEKTQSD